MTAPFVLIMIYNKEKGIAGLLQYNYVGGLSYLSAEELQNLDVHLENNLYQTSKEVVHHIKRTYKVLYSV